MTPKEKELIEQTLGKPFSQVKPYEIPTYIRNRDKRTKMLEENLRAEWVEDQKKVETNY